MLAHEKCVHFCEVEVSAGLAASDARLLRFSRASNSIALCGVESGKGDWTAAALCDSSLHKDERYWVCMALVR